MKLRNAITLLVALAATAAALFFSRVSGPPNRASQPLERSEANLPGARGEERDQALAKQVELLSAEIAGLKEQARESAAKSAPAAVNVAPPGRENVQESAKAMPTSSAAMHAFYDGVFETQAFDPTWSRTEQQTLSDFFALNPATGQRLEQVECRDTMCRVSLHFDTSTAREAFLTKIGTVPFTRGGFFHADPDTGAFTLFTGREGIELPSPGHDG